jgi:hypothetical protein
MFMDQTSGFIMALIALVIVAIVATIVQRKWGSKGLLWVWIASAVIMTGVILFWSFYKHGFPLPSTRQELFTVAIVSAFLFMMVTLVSGMVVWIVAVVGPRSQQMSSAEGNYFPFNLPMGKLEDTYGLAGILRRYQELLATFATALDTALATASHNPYQPLLRDFCRSFRTYLPSYLRQARADSRQFNRASNALMRDLAIADVVLAELDALAAAQLSAIEECHRVNVRRLRQRSIFRWSWPTGMAVLVSALASLEAAAEEMGGVKPSDLWPLLKGINLTGVNFQPGIIPVVILISVITCDGFHS